MSKLGNIKAAFRKAGSPLWKICFTLRGVTVGDRFVAIGRPGLNRASGSTISIGNSVTLCSSGLANPVAEGGRCRLATLANGATIELEEGVGMSSTVICAAKAVKVGEGTIIGGGALIIDTDFHLRTPEGSWGTDPLAVSQPVRIGKRCFIGARATILKGVTIGDDAVVGAGSVVTKDIEPRAIVGGNPARVIGRVSVDVD